MEMFCMGLWVGFCAGMMLASFIIREKKTKSL